MNPSSNRATSLCIAVLTLVFVSFSSVAKAENETERLIELMTSNRSYRVRAQSALSLGRVATHSSVIALIRALDDEHPVVRAVAANSLGRIGSPTADPALSRIAADPTQLPEVVAQARYALELIRSMASRSQSVNI